MFEYAPTSAWAPTSALALPFLTLATAPASASEYAPALAVVPLPRFFDVSAFAPAFAELFVVFALVFVVICILFYFNFFFNHSAMPYTANAHTVVINTSPQCDLML